MKKTLIIAVSIASLLSNSSCGDKKPKQEPIVAPQGMNVLDLRNNSRRKFRNCYC